MPRLWDEEYPRRELLRRVGRLEQVAGVRLVSLADGPGRGVRVLEFRTGTGFAFEVLVDRSFDVGRCEMSGRPLSWLAPPGSVGPWYYEPDDWGWFRSWGGGMVVTCGLDHTMVAEDDTAEQFHQPHMFTTVRYGLHGRVGGIPARLVGYGERWDGDACTLWAEGVVLQAAVFGEQLALRRRIEATVGESSFRIHDQVENVGFNRTSHMLLYHCNAGFPLVDAGSELLVPARSVTCDPWVEVAGHTTLIAPTVNAQEACFYFEPAPAVDGTVPVAVVNRRLGLGVYQVFRTAQLPHFLVWRMPGEGSYAVGLEPGTNPAISRAEARRQGKIIELDPGDTRTYDLELGALNGAAELDAFAERVQMAARPHG